MIKSKIYKYDDEFKSKARAHQFRFQEQYLHDSNEEKIPQVVLSKEAAEKGLIFCDGYRELIHNKIKEFRYNPLFSNMLRSEHIPYNIFTPMETDTEQARNLFNEMIGGGIFRITNIYIEFAGQADKREYLNDGTSFDTFIEYEDSEHKKGGIGIEVKYTENGYPIGKKELADIENTLSPYWKMTKKSNYYVPDFDVHSLTKAHHLRQIWRNHLLGYAMIEHGDIKRFHHIHLYPQGNLHFLEYALPEYDRLLSPKGKETFIGLTYENLFLLIKKYFTTEKQKEWIRYLYKRYIDF